MKNKSITRPSVDIAGALRILKIATTIDIDNTGNYEDASQQAWDTLVTVIGMRAQPVVLTDPEYVDFSTMDDVSLTGSGYVFEFASEHQEAFATHDDDFKVVDPVGVLKILLDDVVINGVTVTIDSNLEIIVTGNY